MTALPHQPGDDEDGSLRYGDVAVGYRINAQSRVLEEALMRFGIPYQLVGGVRFYERREVKDTLAYVRLARNPADRVALGRIINVPARGIGGENGRGAQCLGRVTRYLSVGSRAGRRGKCNLAARSRAQLAIFGELMRGLMAMVPNDPPSAIFDAALERSGLRAAVQDGTEDGEERRANVMELRNHAANSTRSSRPRDSPGSWRRSRSSATRTSSRTCRTA
jgi:DNA helicase-2/ATP-dependent DNA helicase PcrA